MTRVLALLIVCWSASAEDARLAELKATLVAMRGRATEHRETRGATATLTTAKHQLRDWIESRLPELLPDGEPAVLASQLNQELKRNGMFCGSNDKCEESPGSFDALGFLEDLRLKFDGSFLIVQTSAGIQCGFDDSAYLYEWNGTKWNRVWESEQNSYKERDYKPQRIHDVLISPNREANTDQMTLTLGTQPWCASNWHSVYYRLWRRQAGSPAPKLLVDGSEFAFLERSTPIQGRLGPDDALVEYTSRSIDGGVLTREAVRHYKVSGNEVRRIDPIALSPRDFVDEWLTQPWNDAASWAAGSIERWQQELHSNHVSGDFQPTMHCKTPDLWQVGITLKNTDAYFLVRWRSPYQFRMVDVRKTPWPNCTEKDPAADEWRTLFPAQNWR